MKYGIHLGNDYAAISRMENGVPVIIKTNTLKDVMPSCVSVSRRGSIKVGDTAINDLIIENSRDGRATNVYIDFVRMLGSDITYPCSNLGRDLTPIDLCAAVLNELKSYVTEESVRSAVITVPATFRTAIFQAAKLAGIGHCELLLEPIAASMAYVRSHTQKDGIILLFNFNYRSYDASLIKIENGIMQVFDTDGDNYLGGNNLDEAIVDRLIIPYLQANYSIDGILADKQKNELLRKALRPYANDARNQLSNRDSIDIISNLGDLGEDEDGDEIELDLTLIQSQVYNVMRPVFQKAVDVCLKLIRRNNLSVEQLSMILLVGSDIQSPLIRQMLSEQITPKVHTRTNPMTAMATGAALYASTIDTERQDDDIKQGKVRLDVGYSPTTIESTEWISVRLLDNSIDSVLVELESGDKMWSSGKVEIDARGDVIETPLREEKTITFTIVTYDHQGNRIPCHPNEITICRAIDPGPALLPYSFAVQAERDLGVVKLHTITGLEKSKPLPAMGTLNCLKTRTELRPGNSSDIIHVPIYQTDFDSYIDSTPAFLHEHVADIIITGGDVPQYIPQNSKMDITLKVDKSEMIQARVFFPNSFATIENAKIHFRHKHHVNDIQTINELEIIIAQLKLQLLEKEGMNTSFLKSHLDLIAKEFENSSDPMILHHYIIGLLREIYIINI